MTSSQQIAPIDGLSYVRGADAPPLSTQTIPALFADTASSWPDRPALAFGEQGVRWTRSEFRARVDAFAAGLMELGLHRGDRTGIWSPTRFEWLVTESATVRIGLILVNISPAYRLSELEHALNASGCRAIVAAEQLRTSMCLEMLQTLAPELTACGQCELESQQLIVHGWMRTATPEQPKRGQIAHFKARYIRFVDDLPMTITRSRSPRSRRHSGTTTKHERRFLRSRRSSRSRSRIAPW